MNSMNADDALRTYLAPIKERTEIRDEAGKLIGIFAPACDLLSDLEKSMYDEIIKQIDPEEITRRRASRGNHPGYTWEQVLERLHALEVEEQGRLRAEQPK
jgi:hypothetical protein